jgi:hypothetical protein
MTGTILRTTFGIKTQKNVIQQNAIQTKVVQHNDIVMTLSCMMIS